MKTWWLLLTMLLAASCMATEGQEATPTPVSTQIADLAADIVVYDGATDTYSIPDQGDGCVFKETHRTPDLVLPSGEVVPARVMLIAEGCGFGWTYTPATHELHRLQP